MTINSESPFDLAKAKAKDRLGPLHQKGELIGPFDKIDYSDPWLEWLWKDDVSPGSGCDVIIVLQDWGEEYEEGELSRILEDKKTPKDDADDRTLRIIINAFKPEKIRARKVIIFNAVWALRKKGSSKTGELSERIHKAAFPNWADMVKTLCSDGKWRQVCLCGAWAKWSKTTEWPEIPWGEFRDGPQIIGLWKKWASSNDVSPEDFRNLEFCTIPHPSAWRFDFRSFLVRLHIS